MTVLTSKGSVQCLMASDYYNQKKQRFPYISNRKTENFIKKQTNVNYILYVFLHKVRFTILLTQLQRGDTNKPLSDEIICKRLI